MPHSFSNCPLRSCALLITHHQTQSIVTATDDMLDWLGYSLKDLIGHSIHHALHIQLSSNLTSNIPECTLQHAQGHLVLCQICIHQDPLNSYHCLDYWLIQRQPGQSEQPHLASPLSVIRLSPYGTIDQVIHANLAQSTRELMGRPVMAYVYQDDVQPLCARLSRRYLRHSPLLIRWSRLPCILTTSPKEVQDSIHYDWVAFSVDTGYHPVCLIRPLQITTQHDVVEQKEAEIGSVVLAWFVRHKPIVSEWLCQTRAYVSEFCQYLSFYWQTVFEQDYDLWPNNNNLLLVLQKLTYFVTPDKTSS